MESFRIVQMDNLENFYSDYFSHFTLPTVIIILLLSLPNTPSLTKRLNRGLCVLIHLFSRKSKFADTSKAQNTTQALTCFLVMIKALVYTGGFK